MSQGIAVDTVFAALADATRRDVLEALAEGGAAGASALARALPVSRQAIAKHLDILEAAGLVKGRRHGREIRFTVQSRALWATARWLERAAGRWDERGRVRD